MNEHPERQTGRPSRLGLRQFMAEVNLRDFSAMVGTEARLIPTSVAAAWRRGPVFVPLSLLVALVRAVLLVLVVVFFGGGIVLITLGRTIFRRGSA